MVHHLLFSMQPSSVADWPEASTPMTGYCGPGPARTLRSVTAETAVSARAEPDMTTSAPATAGNRIRFMVSLRFAVPHKAKRGKTSCVPANMPMPAHDLFPYFSGGCLVEQTSQAASHAL